MNNQASRVAVVNQIARQLMHNGHPSEKDIKAQQDKLNNRYTEGTWDGLLVLTLDLYDDDPLLSL